MYFPTIFSHVNEEGVYQGPETFDGSVVIDHPETKLISLGNLVNVLGDLYIEGAVCLKDLGALKNIKGFLYLGKCNAVGSLGCLKHVGGDADIMGCGNLQDLGLLETIGGEFYVSLKSEIKKPSRLRVVRGNLTSCYAFSASVEYPFLERVGKCASLNANSLRKCKKLKKVGELRIRVGELPPPNLELKTLLRVGVGDNVLTVKEYLANVGKVSRAKLTDLPAMLFNFPAIYHPFISRKLKGEAC